MMLEELIEKYIAAKAKYEAEDAASSKGYLNHLKAMDAAHSTFAAGQELLTFIEKHSGTLISWERQHALRTSPFDDLG